MRALKTFSRNRSGNITIMFALMLAVILLFTGGAVDFTRRNSVRADLIESLDAAGLAVAQLDESGLPEMANMTVEEKNAFLKDYGVRFFHENFSHENEIENFALDFEMNEQIIRPVASGKIKTLFLGIAENLLGLDHQFETLSMAASTEITRRGSGPIELALVLDVTGSMSEIINGAKKIDSLKEASDALLDALYGDDPNATSDNVNTSVVPFAAFVNSGGAIDGDGAAVWNSGWGDTSAAAVYHGAHFLHVTSAGAINLNTKVNHFTLFNSIPGEAFAGCFEERPYPLDEIDVAAGTAASNAVISGFNIAPTGTTNTLVQNAFTGAPNLSLPVATLSGSENSRFVPLFQADDPNCNDGSSSNDACEWGTSTSTRVGITFSGSWFQDPDTNFSGASYPGSSEGSSIRESSYTNSYIDDKQFTRTIGSNLDKYLPVVNYFRRVLRYHVGGNTTQCPTSPSTTQSDPGLNAWLSAPGATECFDDEYILRQAYVGQFNLSTSKYVGKLDLANSISSSRGPNDNCPVALLANSDSKATLHDYIQALQPGGNTNSAEGLMWGWRVLSPEAPFVSPNPYNDDKWQKAVVLMSDGFNTVSSRSTHWKSDMTPYGYATEARMGVGVDTASEMRDQIDQKLLRICARMKEKGILVYAITFGLSDSDPSEAATKQIFQACATDDEAPYYFDAPNGDDLKDAFADIAADLVQLHVSK